MTVLNQDRPELPAGWAQTRIGDICDLVNGRAFKPTEWVSAGIPIIRIQNLNNLLAEFNYCNFEVEEKFLVDDGQLLFAWSGTPGTSFGAHIWNRGKAVLNQHIFKVNINENYLDKIFLKHLFNCNVKEYIGKAHGTAGLAHITKGKFEESKIPLPPFNEQKRIANKVEELFSFLDAGTDALRKVQSQLKRYRHAVLKYAFEGKLTEDWRQSYCEQIEPAHRILERIELAKGRNSNLMAVPVNFKRDKLFNIPNSWIWSRIGKLFDVGVGSTPKRGNLQYWNGDIPWVRSSEVAFARIKQTRECITEEGLKKSNLQLRKPGTILLAMIGEGKTRGQSAILDVAATTNQNVASIIPIVEQIPSEYIFYWLMSRYEDTRKSGVGGAQPALNCDKVRQIPIPLAPTSELNLIVRRIEEVFAMCADMEAVTSKSLAEASSLKQSILFKAFTGKLVPQDANDESSEKLLASINTANLSYRKSTNEGKLESSKYVK